MKVELNRTLRDTRKIPAMESDESSSCNSDEDKTSLFGTASEVDNAGELSFPGVFKMELAVSWL